MIRKNVRAQIKWLSGNFRLFDLRDFFNKKNIFFVEKTGFLKFQCKIDFK